MKYITLLLVTLSVLLVGCSNEGDSAPKQTTAAQGENKSDNAVHQPSGGAVAVLDANNQTIASLFLTGSPRIEFGGQKITSKIGSSGKRKYLDQTGAVVAKINNDRNGKIKLKSEQGSLIWKVKAKPGSIKIADNEEMNSAYKIKTKDAGRYKLLANENELGTAELIDGVVTISAPDAAMTVSGTDESASGVLGFSDVPMVYRLIIFSELSLSSQGR